MNNVFVSGIGQVPVQEHWDKSIKEIAGDAALVAMEDWGQGYPQAIFVGNMMAGSANKQFQFSNLLADWLGFSKKESLGVETACSSGAMAFRSALLAIAAGELDSALVVGVEKMTDSPSSEITASLATAADAELEFEFGLSFVSINALVMQRYMYEYGWKNEDFAAFSINAHSNGIYNPYARFQKAINVEDYNSAGMISNPINLMDASPIGDGAAAIILTSDSRDSQTKIRVVGSASATDTISVQARKNPTWLQAAEFSAKQAYSQAGLIPSQINLFESHDAFSIMAALSLESSGFCAPGEAPKLANEGKIRFDSDIPVSTFGGLKARGHPVGATGVYQLVEVTKQLRWDAGVTQVENARVGMAQNIGGSGSNITTHILVRE